MNFKIDSLVLALRDTNSVSPRVFNLPRYPRRDDTTSIIDEISCSDSRSVVVTNTVSHRVERSFPRISSFVGPFRSGLNVISFYNTDCNFYRIPIYGRFCLLFVPRSFTSSVLYWIIPTTMSPITTLPISMLNYNKDFYLNFVLRAT